MISGWERGRDCPHHASAVAHHACSNCDGIDPDTCLTNPTRVQARVTSVRQEPSTLTTPDEQLADLVAWSAQRHAGHGSPCEERPDGSCARPEPASACAHCGGTDHTWDDCQAYMDAVATDAAPAALRDQVAAAIRARATFDFDTHVIGDAERITDAVLQVRDTEMERLRGELGALKQAHVALAEQAGKDQTAVAAVREWLPALRRAVDCLDATCRYHGDQLDPDFMGHMAFREACCDTGIEPRRAREARAALDALTRLTQEQQ
jgi:hypothetical protein